MKLFILNKIGIWENVNSHPLPVTVELFPQIEIGTVKINGQALSITNGKFVIDTLSPGVNTVTVNGIECEPLYCREINGSTHRVNAIGDDMRGLIPYIAQITNLNERIERLETQFAQKDFFG